MSLRSTIIQAMLLTTTVVNAAKTLKKEGEPKLGSTSSSAEMDDKEDTGVSSDYTDAFPRIMYWVTPFFLSSFLLFVFMLLIFNIGVGLLNDIKVPSY